MFIAQLIILTIVAPLVFGLQSTIHFAGVMVGVTTGCEFYTTVCLGLTLKLVETIVCKEKEKRK